VPKASLLISSPFTQNNRLFRLESPLGDALLLDRFQGTEAISGSFRFTLKLLSERADLRLKDMVGEELQVFLATGAEDRRFSGHVTEFGPAGGDGGFAFYRAILAPWTDFLRYRSNCRIFHEMTLPELLRKLFDEYGQLARYELNLTPGAYPPITQCTQYYETDFDFFSRLLEAHGIYYIFRFDAKGHTLVLADDSRLAKPMPIRDRIEYNTEPGAGGNDTLDRWTCQRRVVSTAYGIKSFDFRNPQDRLESRAATTKDLGRFPELERYEHEGSFAYAGHEAGNRVAQLRLEEEELRSLVFTGAGNCRFLACGHTFELHNHGALDGAAQERRFLVTSVTHKGTNNYLDTGGNPHYRNQVTCVKDGIPFRPPLATPRPRMPGPQTATVVGPAGEEIFCDSYGRIRVQFHWDREGTFTEASSCWVRVGSPWAGDRFGLVSLPRVGSEVVVDFLEGNPDRPVIIGQVYNESNMPPWPLPANRTQSGILSRSSLGGGYETANALRFEDKKGAEEVWLHAEKDQRLEVEHDESHTVGHDRRKAIGHDETTQVEHDRTEAVGHDEVVQIGHDRTETVGGDERVAVDGHQELNVGHSQHISVGTTKFENVILASTEMIGGAKILGVGAAYSVNVGAAKNETVGLGSFQEVGLEKATQVGKTYHIKVADQLEINVGQSRLVMAKDGTISLSGVKLEFNGATLVKITGENVDVN
jgi:type VI secretion system secreted protein VgrG